MKINSWKIADPTPGLWACHICWEEVWDGKDAWESDHTAFHVENLEEGVVYRTIINLVYHLSCLPLLEASFQTDAAKEASQRGL